jgi:hypothetical protein
VRLGIYFTIDYGRGYARVDCVSTRSFSEESPERVLASSMVEIEEGGADSLLWEEGSESVDKVIRGVFVEFLVDLPLDPLTDIGLGSGTMSRLDEGFDILRMIFRGLDGPGSEPKSCDVGDVEE